MKLELKHWETLKLTSSTIYKAEICYFMTTVHYIPLMSVSFKLWFSLKIISPKSMETSAPSTLNNWKESSEPLWRILEVSTLGFTDSLWANRTKIVQQTTTKKIRFGKMQKFLKLINQHIQVLELFSYMIIDWKLIFVTIKLLFSKTQRKNLKFQTSDFKSHFPINSVSLPTKI